MDKKIEDRLLKAQSLYDHIVWYGKCTRCDSLRFLFMDELRHLGYNQTDDMRGEKFLCKGGQCMRRVRMKGRVNNKRARHLNDVRSR